MKRCVACGEGRVVPVGGEGRRTGYKNLTDLEVPADLVIPTCNHCGVEWMDDEVAQRMDTALEPVYRKRLSQMAAQALEALAGVVRQGELERKLGLAQGYLTKLKRGNRVPSAELALHLAAIALNPESRLQEMDDLLEFGFTFVLGQRSSLQGLAIEDLACTQTGIGPSQASPQWDSIPYKERSHAVPVAA